MPKTLPFSLYLRQLKDKHFGSVRALADALHVDPTHVSRAMGDHGRSFDIYGLLRLAEVTGEDPDEVLRMGGKGRFADLFDRVYMRRRTQSAQSAPERLDKRVREAVRLVTRFGEQHPEDEVFDIIVALVRRSERLQREDEKLNEREQRVDARR